MKITDIKFRRNPGSPNSALKAYVSAVFDDCFAVKSMKIIESGETGHVFLAMPSRKRSDGKFQDICHPINHETREWLETSVLSAWKKEKNGEHETE